jgi:hypothetical protein
LGWCVVGRRAGDMSGLRQLLLDDYRRSLERWRQPGKAYEKEEALACGVPVVVGAADLMCALMHAGLPHSPSRICRFCTRRYKIERCGVVGAFDGRSVAVKLHERTLLIPYRGAALDGAVRGSCQPNAAGLRESAVRSAEN